jgi:cytochrome b561
MAALVLLQLAWGWRTSLLPAGYDKLDAYAVHAAIGLAIFLLAFLRAGWRILALFILPKLEEPEDFPGWQKAASIAVHAALYVLMFALPLTGWLMLSASTRGGPIALPFGLAAPAFPPARDMGFLERAVVEEAAEEAHAALVWILAALVAAHIGAALKHQFIDRDLVLARMIPWLTPLGADEAVRAGAPDNRRAPQSPRR